MEKTLKQLVEAVNGLGSRMASMEQAQAQAGLGRIVPERAPEAAPQAVTEDWTVFVFRVDLSAGTLTAIDDERVDATGHFDLCFITALNSLDPTNLLPIARFRIRDGEQGKFLTSNSSFVDLRNMSGTGQRPYWLNGRRRFRANSTITIEFQNVQPPAIQDVEIEMALHGIKVSV